MANKKVYTGKNGGEYTLTKTGRKSYLSHATRGLPKVREVSRNGKSNARHWQLHLSPSTKYCGTAGGAAKHSFPVNTEKRCRAALSYSRFAKRPCGIISCALRQAAKKGWKCGTTSKGAKNCGCNKRGHCTACKGCK